jgi:hypothetical protein
MMVAVVIELLVLLPDTITVWGGGGSFPPGPVPARRGETHKVSAPDRARRRMEFFIG